MKRILFAAGLTAALTLPAAGPAAAQYAYNDGYGHAYQRPAAHYGSSRRSWSSFNGQADRPGDYRCDAFWDANRTDCGAGWRDQRRYSSRASWNDGRHGYGHGGGYYGRGRGYGSAYGGHGRGGTVYNGAYGRPDVVFPSGGRGYSGHGGQRDAARMDWCRWNYRSYDPRSGYYRAYSGRLVYCG